MTTLEQGNKLFSQLLLQTAETAWQRFSTFCPNAILTLDDIQQEELRRIMGLSDFIAEQICRHPDWLSDLFNGGLSALDRNQFANELQALLINVEDEESFKSILRAYRNRQMVCIAWRDFLGYCELEASLVDLSVLAEVLVIAGRNWLYQKMCLQYGTPCDEEGKPQSLLILGMGKLGGKELNFSSDIDLIFTFPEHGETKGGRRSLENQEFFIRLGQRLIQALHQVTCDGFVYRVDLRLRPYGESGPLVVSFSGLEDYYQEQGRDWERYAMVKARPLGPEDEHTLTLQSMLRPFVYRRYIDFSAIDALRRMKQLITQEVRRRSLKNNIKLGAGGIREVEFVVQSFQLIRGGREPTLRQQSLFSAIDNLYQLGVLEYLAVDELKKNYVLLRRVENLLQAINDEQTQTLPDDELNWQRLCYGMGISTPDKLKMQIDVAMKKVHAHFIDTVGGKGQDEMDQSWTQQLWHTYTQDHAQVLLDEQHIDNADFWPILQEWRQAIANRTIGSRGRETLDKLMPRLFVEFFIQTIPSTALEAVSKVLNQILTRTTYLELLYENPGARQQLVRLCCASPWIAEQLANFPMLLDELIDPTQLYHITSLSDYASELRQYLLRVPEDDLEQQMEALRQFKLTQQLKVAAADVTGILPVMVVSDHLTLLAEAITEQVVIQAWAEIKARHGVPPNLAHNEMGFAIVGYGKAGGVELGYGSDLDLVFLHNSQGQAQTNGGKPIDVGRFYLKLAQRILHLFSTRTLSGELYEVDMRLRPSGASGLLVSEIESFGQYQKEEAHTWEHQALVRARCLFGDNELSSRFSELRSDVVRLKREPVQLATDVKVMRKKMCDHLLKVTPQYFDLKQSCGGMVDIEFIAQYLVLAHAHEYKELASWSDNIRIFSALADLDLICVNQADYLTQAYCYLRDENHRLTLQRLPSILPYERVEPSVHNVRAIYHEMLGE
ncbi:bifunctional [glutamate--ammonia ligase]-adenylyl-L-tyrosine phosphorylase/[glutamate--ammonia-ligase] adenylyltransferase [Shewanella surugensis]|uniref:Bifunctional glutamine synthetase adenylyltransferase/adenylyl-removing enzyme n=1 Tax=Shewanella surugensis TaxID=212020 RepID=A0ABT0LDP2_9GAMM|nr:bifunctional [glutamate--ammonia ligase]-adenylyl-L-tyrosine phosphorylase/[glutamate--ammonia-ligase] adenylyltransferase [Shewanella surugensis]MCL1125823.1 bifunctional [glutamate--ammonia ligase]-adenylyl-L-tyrosine phosphorylase/[glutamate--ammonia-ligase] adenylyltransferase [Shewanella surugensis]